MYCKNCGGQIPDQAVICVRCGVQTDAYCEQPQEPFGGTDSPDRYCRNCGSEIPSRAVVCVRCGVPTTAFYTLQSPTRRNSPSNGQPRRRASSASSNDSIDKWAWTLATVPIGLQIILRYALYGLADGIILGIIAFALNVFLFFMDKKELERSGYQPEGWVWLGLVLVPVYLFLRASKINGKYAYAITWCGLFLLSILI